MNILDKLEELNDENLLLVSNMIETLYKTQSKKKVKKGAKAAKISRKKNVKIRDKKVEPVDFVIEEVEEDDDEFEVLPSKKKKKVRPNKFLQMPEFHAHKEDTEWEKKMGIHKVPPVPRFRGSGLVDMTCYKCNKPFKISETLLPKGECRIKCNRCSTTGAG